jgi:D-tyrosyl-tRNA(Tyr) deacylase
VRVLLQRCTRASVSVSGAVVGSIGPGLVAFVGTTGGDGDPAAVRLAERVAGYRIFPDEQGLTNLSVLDVGGQVLVVSQFTLYADTKKGRRPSFVHAGDPGIAEGLVELFRLELERRGVTTAAGRFGASMQVELVNDGPFTILLEQAPQ